MALDRRSVLRILSLAAALPFAPGQAHPQGAESWYPVTGDEGKPVPNMRLPVELTSEVEDAPGVIWAGSSAPDLTAIEFFDYNCPYCRKAARDLDALVQSTPDLRLGLVNNPILSRKSADAARVELALLGLEGPAIAYAFHKSLFGRRGVIDGARALDVAEDLGVPRSRLEGVSESAAVRDALSDQTRLAASLGFATTPSFLIAGAGVLGYPGPNAVRTMLAAVRQCDRIAC